MAQERAIPLDRWDARIIKAPATRELKALAKQPSNESLLWKTSIHRMIQILHCNEAEDHDAILHNCSLWLRRFNMPDARIREFVLVVSEGWVQYELVKFRKRANHGSGPHSEKYKNALRNAAIFISRVFRITAFPSFEEDDMMNFLPKPSVDNPTVPATSPLAGNKASVETGASNSNPDIWHEHNNTKESSHWSQSHQSRGTHVPSEAGDGAWKPDGSTASTEDEIMGGTSAYDSSDSAPKVEDRTSSQPRTPSQSPSARFTSGSEKGDEDETSTTPIESPPPNLPGHHDRLRHRVMPIHIVRSPRSMIDRHTLEEHHPFLFRLLEHHPTLRYGLCDLVTWTMSIKSFQHMVDEAMVAYAEVDILDREHMRQLSRAEKLEVRAAHKRRSANLRARLEGVLQEGKTDADEILSEIGSVCASFLHWAIDTGVVDADHFWGEEFENGS